MNLILFKKVIAFVILQLCHIAQINAEKLYDEDTFEENPIETRRYASENVYLKYSSTRPALITATAEEAIRSWYNEIETYDYSMGPSSPGITGIERIDLLQETGEEEWTTNCTLPGCSYST